MTRAWPVFVAALCAGCIFTSRPMPPPDNVDDAGATFSDVATSSDTAMPPYDAVVLLDAVAFDVSKPPSDASASDVSTAADGADFDGAVRDATSIDVSPADAVPDDVSPADAADAGARCGDAGDAGDVTPCDVTVVDGDSPAVDAAIDAGVDGGETGGAL